MLRSGAALRPLPAKKRRSCRCAVFLFFLFSAVSYRRPPLEPPRLPPEPLLKLPPPPKDPRLPPEPLLKLPPPPKNPRLPPKLPPKEPLPKEPPPNVPPRLPPAGGRRPPLLRGGRVTPPPVPLGGRGGTGGRLRRGLPQKTG